MNGVEEEESASERSGECPNCDAAIPSAYVLIRYETSDGWPRLFAECPACKDVVHPQGSTLQG